MANILDKVKMLLRVNVHDLLDKALQKKSPEVIKRHVADLEDARRMIVESIATLRARQDELRRDIVKNEKETVSLNTAVDQFLRNGQEADAKSSLKRVQWLQEQTQQYQDELVKLDTDIANQRENVGQLEDRIAKLKFEAENIEQALKQAEAFDKVNEATRVADAVMGKGGDIDWEQLRRGAYNRLDQKRRLNEELNNSLEKRTQDVVADANLDAELEKRKKDLGLG